MWGCMMKLTKQSKTKLDLIRLDGLCKLILSKYGEEDVINKISNITKSTPKNSKAIHTLSRAQLKLLIESSSITDDEINKCYEEYRYGLKPGFSIFSFKSNKKISINQVRDLLRELLKDDSYGEDEQPVIKNIRFNNIENFKKEKITEYSFYYLKKHSYINERQEPTYIYESKETFVWISIEDDFVAIRNCDERVVKILSSVISKIYETDLYPILLTEDLVKKIFGDRRKKVSGVNPNATEREAEKITISDSRLHEKEEVKKQLESYATTSETLEITVDDIINTLGINNSKGKIHLTKNMTSTTFRKWSITTIREIIKQITENETEFEIFKAKNIMNNQKWTAYTTEQKKVVEEIIYKIICFSKNKNYNPIIQTKLEYSKLSKIFLNKIFVECKECNDTFCIPKCSCGSYDIRMTTKKNIICSNCGETLADIECEEGHKISIRELENINAFLIPNFQLYKDIIDYIYEEFGIQFNGVFSILNSNLEILESSNGCLVKVGDIKEFEEVSRITINKVEKEELYKKLKRINEKCTTPSKENCNNCDDTKICLLKVFTTFEGYRPGPHHGHEFGDVNFKVTYKNEKIEFVGIAKSNCNLTRSCLAAREMLQQILIASQDKQRIGIIGAICPAKFDEQLEKDLEYLAKCTQSKIIILDDIFMEKQLKNYCMVNEIDKNGFDRILK